MKKKSQRSPSVLTYGDIKPIIYSLKSNLIDSCINFISSLDLKTSPPKIGKGLENMTPKEMDFTLLPWHKSIIKLCADQYDTQDNSIIQWIFSPFGRDDTETFIKYLMVTTPKEYLVIRPGKSNHMCSILKNNINHGWNGQAIIVDIPEVLFMVTICL